MFTKHVNIFTANSCRTKTVHSHELGCTRFYPEKQFKFRFNWTSDNTGQSQLWKFSHTDSISPKQIIEIESEILQAWQSSRNQLIPTKISSPTEWTSLLIQVSAHSNHSYRSKTCQKGRKRTTCTANGQSQSVKYKHRIGRRNFRFIDLGKCFSFTKKFAT